MSGIAAVLAATAALAPPALADPASDQAAQQATDFLRAHDRGCGTVKIVKATAHQTFYSEVTATRPAGFDVTLQVLIRHTSSLPQYLVAGGRVYPDNSTAGSLALGCQRDPPPPQDALEWHALPYLSVDTGSFGASASGLWHGARVNPHFDVALAGQPATALWAPHCAAGVQVAHFDRTLYLLGPADSMSVETLGLSVSRAGFGVPPVPFTHWELEINGHVVWRTASPSGGNATVSAAGLRAIRFGPNQFRVIVSKRATGPCNRSGAPQYAVEFAFNGLSHANTSGSSLPVSGSGACFPGQCLGVAHVPFRLSNLGPLTLLEPRLDVQFTFTPSEQGEPPTFSGTEDGLAHSECLVTQTGPVNWHLVCEWSPFSAGASGTLDVAIHYTIATHSAQVVPIRETWRFDWGVAGLNTAGASGSGTITTCFPQGSSCTAPVS